MMYRYLLPILLAAVAAAQPGPGGQIGGPGSPAAALPVVTFAQLPAAANATNRVYLVRDCTSATSCAVGGGTARVLLVSNGSAWSIIGGASGGGVGGGSSLTTDYSLVTVSTTDGVLAEPPFAMGVTNGLFKVAGSQRTTGTATSVLTGTIDPAASTTVTGVGTLFTTELTIGDRITVTGETRTVTAIASATSLTVDTAFSNNANDTSPDKLSAIQVWRLSDGTVAGVVNDLGNVGIGTTNPSDKLEVKGGSGTGEVGIYGMVLSTTHTGYTTKLHIGSNFNQAYMFQNASYNGSSWVADSTGKPVAGIILSTMNSAAGDIRLFTSATDNAGQGTERVRIDKNGNLGIGTTIPPDKLSVLGAAGIYGDYTGASNYYGGTITSTDGALTIAAVTAGTGADNQNVVLTPAGTGSINITTGHLLWTADNTYDIGASGATRPRTGYFGTSVITGRLTLSGDVTLPLLMAKTTQSATAPAAGNCVLRWEAGTNANTGKLVGYCGTSSTGSVIIDNVGGGL